MSLLPEPGPSATSHPHLEASISSLLVHAWAPSTRSLYDHGVQRFRAFCLSQGIPLPCCLPANEFLLCAFAADSAGSHSGGAIRSDLNVVRAWHLLNGAPWHGGLRLQYTLSAADRCTPASSRRPIRPPVAQEMIDMLCSTLDASVPLFAAVRAAACFAYWGQCRLGEVLPDSLASFTSSRFPTPACLRPVTASGLSRTCHLPFTKVGKERGEDIFLGAQRGPSNSLAALDAHLATNSPPPDGHLFAYLQNGVLIPLTRRKFLAVCNSLWSRFGFPAISGHCFRIGGTTELLLRGVPPHVVQLLGRWHSDAFLRYWRFIEDIAPSYAVLLGDRVASFPSQTIVGSRR